MFKSRLFTLLKMNLIYMNPQYTVQLRKKGKSGKKLVRSLLTQQLMLALLFLFMYSTMMVPLKLGSHPGFFAMYVALFTLMAVAQSVSVIFNVFYESNDLKDFLALPFKMSEVFLAKFLVVALGVVPFLLPIFSVFFLTATDAGMPVVFAVLFSLFLFLLFSLFIYTLCVWGISAFAQTKFFQQHQKMMTTGMMMVTTAGMLGGIFYLNFKTSSSNATLKDAPKIFLFTPLYEAITKPGSLVSLAVIFGMIALTALAALFIFKTVIPRFYQQSTQHIVQKVKRKKAGRSLQKMLVSYNLNLIKDPTLLMQAVTMTLIFPVAFIFPLLSLKGLIGNISLNFAGAFFLGGLGLSYLSVTTSSLVAVIISLDQERFSFMKSLPLSFKSYLKVKFWTMTVLQMLLNSVVVLALILISGISLLLGLCLLLGSILGTYLLCEFYFYRDYRFLTLNWTNITQLFTRGGGNFARMLAMFAGYLVLALVIGLFVFLLHLSPILGNVIILLLLVGAFVGGKMYFERAFWQKLD